jgi:hypothetical protein
MRTDCARREETWSVVTRYGADDRRLDASSASYADPQPVVAGALGEAELDFICAADRTSAGGFPLAIDEVAFAEALIADTQGSISPADLHDRLRADPKVPVIRSSAPGPDSFGAEQYAKIRQTIVSPRDYAKGTRLPTGKDYDADETGTIYDIAYMGLDKGEAVFEQRGYSVTDLADAGSGQTMRVPIEQKNVQVLDIDTEIIDALRYRATLRKRDGDEVPDCAAGDCEPALTGGNRAMIQAAPVTAHP